MASKTIPRILVVGGGAGGLELVTTLGKKLGKKGLAKIYLSDGNPTHIWKPLLHEVATGTLNVGEDEVNYFTHAKTSGYRFHYGWMNGLDRDRKVIKTDEIRDLEGNVISEPRECKYDTLVMALGSLSNTFGVKGVYEHCNRLDTAREAERLRKRLLGHALQLIFNKIQRIKIGIVGAGPTGVELACEIHRTMAEIKAYGARISKKDLEITIIEAGPQLLPGSLPHITKFAEQELEKKGIHIKTSCQITCIDEKGFHLKDGTVLEKDIKIWTAGIKAPDWLKDTGLQLDKVNKIKVDPYLQSPDDPNIFALGDCAHSPDPNNPDKTFPATAQCAHQQAEWLAKKLINDINKKPTKKPFMFQSQGMLVSLGHTTAVGTVAGITPKKDFHLRGRSAKFIYSSLYRMHQAAIYGNLRALGILAGDKLRGLTLPEVKLH